MFSFVKEQILQTGYWLDLVRILFLLMTPVKTPDGLGIVITIGENTGMIQVNKPGKTIESSRYF